MKQLTIRGFDDALARRIRRVARAEGVSLNQAVIRLLQKGAGLDQSTDEPEVIGDALDHLIGTWSDDEAAELARAVGDFETIDLEMWR